MIHQPFVTRRSSSPNQFVPKIVSPLPCSTALVRHKLLFAYVFKELILFMGYLNKCHTSVFNALISPFSDTQEKNKFKNKVDAENILRISCIV